MSTGGSVPEPRGAARQRLESELANLREQRRNLASALDSGDVVGDDADTAQALEESRQLAWYDNRIRDLERRLSGGADFSEALPTDTRVTLKFSDGTTQTMRIVAITEEIIEGEEDETITVKSPLGSAIAGHKPGDRITYSTAAGTEEAEILDIRMPSRG
ncbi:GreA/GreB family elongation factor [Saccharopolyspora rectivirgula]|jgi:transcription elongation factor GreA|uniref:Transcription elongation factor GreA/GreB C-terminal domain-containing protein n=1 Tax=Saccharopolyspora rectivirgula TaxID=28042 RepID=A0A073AVZ1_9PSEU|nr:GreA/GreB family elongation factor [Saccharopolyspora rectivirgula]KEI43560.1 hypothetical protein GU90_14550 [Saccharopolyspora rectivirgula]